MIEKDISSSAVVMILYVIAAVSGGLGGCAAGCYYLTHDKRPRLAFAVSYALLGVVFGVITFAVISAYHFPELDSVHKAILFSIIGGLAGAVMLASANLTVLLLFRKLGIEIQITMRKSGEDRRDDDR